MAGMYCMADLLRLLQHERAEELRLVAGAPPRIAGRGRSAAIDAPALTPDELDALLGSISTDVQRVELQKCGDVRFIYLHASTRFAVAATHSDGALHITIKNLDL